MWKLKENNTMNWFFVDEIIKNALKEDMNNGDVTTDALIDNNQCSEGNLYAKERGVLAGIVIFERVFFLLDPKVRVQAFYQDGEWLDKGSKIAKIIGPTASILKGERVALNLLQRMSGIATQTAAYVSLTEGYNVRIVDTRKTTPNLRVIEKYAVKVGGGHNHRYNLSEAVMIKDNHIQAVGSIEKAVLQARNNIPHTMKIEIEVETLDQLQEALAVKADIIMLDNMDTETMRKAVEMAKGSGCILEASGNMTEERVVEVAQIGVEVISIGALTHSVKALDISLKF